MRDITFLINEQRNSKEYSNVKKRISTIFIIDEKIAIIKEIITDDRKCGSHVINGYVNLINKLGNNNTYFFDEYLAHVCLNLFHSDNKTNNFRKDIYKTCENLNLSIFNTYINTENKTF